MSKQGVMPPDLAAPCDAAAPGFAGVKDLPACSDPARAYWLLCGAPSKQHSKHGVTLENWVHQQCACSLSYAYTHTLSVVLWCCFPRALSCVCARGSECWRVVGQWNQGGESWACRERAVDFCHICSPSSAILTTCTFSHGYTVFECVYAYAMPPCCIMNESEIVTGKEYCLNNLLPDASRAEDGVSRLYYG